MKELSLSIQSRTKLKRMGYGTCRVLFVLALMLMQISAHGRQGERVTLSFKNGSLQIILDEIRRQTGYLYALQDQWKKEARPIDIFVKDVPVQDALDICFKDQPFTYTIISRTIVVKMKLAADRKTANIPGTPTNRDTLWGQALNEEGKPLPGATIEISNLSRKVVADEDGSFFFNNIPYGRHQLEVSFIGYERSQTVVHLNKTSQRIVVNLKHNTGSLDEVQVIAYGTTTKRLNTGNVSTVKSEDIEKQPVTDPLLALIGRVPGMEISQDNGIPGSVVRVQIRGINSITQGIAPLFVIDGVPYPAQTLMGVAGSPFGSQSSGSPFSFISPSDIESIDVLKDADATAIYGSQGANGVVLITTKKGKAGRTTVSLNVQDGVGTDPVRLKMLNTRQYLDMRYEAFRNDHASPNPDADYDLTLWDTTRNTDWQKVFLGGTAQYSDFQGSLSGGNTNTQFLFSADYHKETLVFPGSFNDQKGSAHLSVTNLSPNKKFKFSLSGVYLVDDNQLPPYSLAWTAALLAPDAPPLYKSDGSLNWAPNSLGISSWPAAYRNPASNLLSKYSNMTYNFVTNASLSYEFLPGLAIGSTLGYTNMQTNAFEGVPFAATDPSTWATTSRSSVFANNNIQTIIIEPQLSYKRYVLKGLFNILVGTTIEKRTSDQVNYIASGFNSDQQMEDIAAATTLTPGNISKPIYRYNAGFGRLNLNWGDAYLLDLTARRDGSSRFGPANQFHNFFALGAGWLFYKQSFIRQHASFFSFGKLRGSYGTTGNDQIGDYSYLDLFNNIPYIGVPYQSTTAMAPVSLFNPNLAWEETRKLEAGLELGFLKDRIILHTSYYRNISSNQLLQYPLPDITGFTGIEENINAKIENSGWEFELQTTNILGKHFLWNTAFNLSMNHNKLASGAPGLSESFQRIIGHPINSRTLYHFVGVNTITGVYQFSDSHGQTTYNPNPATDQNTILDPMANFFGGLQNTLSYRGIHLEFLFQFVRRPHQLSYLFNAIPGLFSGDAYGSNQPVNVLSRWRQPGDVSKIERFSQLYSSLQTAYSNIMQSDLVWGDASFIRLKNVSLSWQLPRSWLERVNLQSVLLFVHAQNLILLTRYKGLDPETVDVSALPPLRVITGGFKMSF